jgi:hypothetical protein
METANYAPHGMARGFSRMLLVLAIALMAGAMVAQHVAAEKMPANSVSIAKRVGYQKDFCDVGGGDLRIDRDGIRQQDHELHRG